jgi:hypothetical protein
MGEYYNSPMFCGVKKYETGFSWLTIVIPNDPSNEQFKLQVTTNDYKLANTYSVSLVVTF